MTNITGVPALNVNNYQQWMNLQQALTTMINRKGDGNRC